MPRSLALVLALALPSVCALALPHALAQEEPADGTKAIEQLVRDLDAGTAATRDAAQKRLLELGERARPHLSAALDGGSLEVRRRAGALLLRLDELEAARTGRDLTWAGLRGGPERSGVVGGRLPAKRPGVIWSVPVETGKLLEGSVVPSADRIFCLDGVGVVRAYDSAEGRRLWLHEIEDEATITASAVLAAGRLVVPTTKGVVALDAKTGRPAWQLRSSYGSHAAPAVQNRRVYTSLRNVGIRAVDLELGETVFEHKLAPKGALLVAGDLVITGTVEGRLVRIDPTTGGITWERELGSAPQMGPSLAKPGTVVVFVNNRELRAFDTETGEELWMRRLHARSRSESLACSGGRICVPGDSGFFYVLDAHTGRMLWRRDSGMTELGGPCMTATHVVYGANALITCRDADGGYEAWRMLVPARANATPAGWGGRLYVLFDQELRCYE